MRWRAMLAAVLAFVAIDLAVAWARPVLSPDECRYGSIAAQMVASGDWLHLRMSGFHFYEKPPLAYWLMAASIELLGHNALAIRLPAALATGLTAFMLTLAVRRARLLAGEAGEQAWTTGATAALMLLTTAMATACANLAVLDAPFAACVTASCVLFFLAVTEPGGTRGRRWLWLVAAGCAAAAGFMTKGLLALAIPVFAIAPWLIWERRWRDLLVRAWVPVAVCAVLVLPMAACIHSANPSFWERFIVHEHFRRFAGGAQNQPSEGFWFYLVVLPIGLVPWIASLPIAARWWPALARAESGVRFALCWAAGPLVLLSASSGKLPTYALPLVPPMVWLLCAGLLRAFESQGSLRRDASPGCRWLPLLPGLVLVVLGVAAAGLALAGPLSHGLLSRAWTEQGHLCAAIVAVGLLSWGAGDWWAQRAGTAQARLVRSGISLVPALAGSAFLLPTAIMSDYSLPEKALNESREAIMGATSLVTDCKMGHSVAWCLGRDDFIVYGAPEEFDNGMDLPQERERLIPRKDAAARIAGLRERGTVAVVMTTFWAKRMLEEEVPTQPLQTRAFRGLTVLLLEQLPAQHPVSPGGSGG